MHRGIVVRCFLTSLLAVLTLFSAPHAFALTNPNLLVEQLDTSGVPRNITITTGSIDEYAPVVAQSRGSMAPYLRLRLHMLNNGTTTGSVYNFAATSTIQVIFQVYNTTGCNMARVAYFPTAS